MATLANATMPLTWNLPTTFKQSDILDILLPVVSGALSHQLFAWVSGYASLACIIGLLAFLKTYTGQLRSWLEDHFTSTVYISKSDEAYEMLLTWVSSHGLDDMARSTIARVGARRGHYEDGVRVQVKKPLIFSPWKGRFFFWFGGSLLCYRTELKDVGFRKEEEVSITCFGRSSQVLKDLLGDCRTEYLSNVKNKTTIFENSGDSWKRVATKDIRPLSTIIYNQKQHLIGDMKSFLDPETRRWFAKRTIPYRRGYLLYGPPGTGKSSFSLSVAGELDADIYIISIPSVTDQTLRDLFEKLPQKCVVLLEDIDAVGTARSSKLDEANSRPKTSITLSGLLNTLDGVASQEGWILIMTTNHAEKLDEALIRPGRVDQKAEFQLANASILAELFDFIFGGDDAEDRRKSEGESAVDRLATDFAARVPELEFSPAEVISYLLQHRHSPTSAVEHTEEWVAAARHEKEARRTKVLGSPLL